jgi:hypothetical protein
MAILKPVYIRLAYNQPLHIPPVRWDLRDRVRGLCQIEVPFLP